MEAELKMEDEYMDEEFLEENDDGCIGSEDDIPRPSANRKGKRSRKPAPKIADSWTDDDIIKLIGEVEQRPAIWDWSCAEYKVKTNRENAWSEIAVSFENKISIQQLGIKWQYLRRQYRNSCDSLNKTKSGQAASKTPQWKFHSHMAFLGNIEKERNVISVSNFRSALNTVSHFN